MLDIGTIRHRFLKFLKIIHIRLKKSGLKTSAANRKLKSDTTNFLKKTNRTSRNEKYSNPNYWVYCV